MLVIFTDSKGPMYVLFVYWVRYITPVSMSFSISFPFASNYWYGIICILGSPDPKPLNPVSWQRRKLTRTGQSASSVLLATFLRQSQESDRLDD